MLWHQRGVVPFLKIDKGLEDQADGVQMLKPMPGLEALLAEAKAKGIFGTKERSVILVAKAQGIAAFVSQEFDVGLKFVWAGVVRFLDREVMIH